MSRYWTYDVRLQTLNKDGEVISTRPSGVTLYLDAARLESEMAVKVMRRILGPSTLVPKVDRMPVTAASVGYEPDDLDEYLGFFTTGLSFTDGDLS
jgi:hypothetical protein